MNVECKNKRQNSETSKSLKDFDVFLRVISEKNRFFILKMLKEGEACVCEIWEYSGLSQNLTSHHLKVLKDFGLIKSRKQGVKIFYSLNGDVFKKHLHSLYSFFN